MPTRAAKELRSLLPPAALILAATAVSALSVSWVSHGPVQYLAAQLGDVAFVVGIPLLAAWSLGSEFQHRTLPLLLAQPLGRTRLWFEKWLTVALAVSVIVPIQLATIDSNPFNSEFTLSTRVLFVAAVLASTPLWTLLTRSTIGGLALAGGAICSLELAASFVTQGLAPGGARTVVFARTPVLDLLRAIYMVITFAAGWWVFTRYQAAALDRSAGPVADVGSSRGWGMTRYRSTGALRNLAITEMHLHRSTWLACAWWAAGWLVSLFFVALLRPSNHAVDATFGILFVLYLPVAIVLTGTMSLSEDSTFGVHGWRLTVPIRARTQWLVKLAATCTAGGIVLFAVPLAMGSLVAVVMGSPDLTFPPFVTTRGTVVTMCAVILCFWGAALFGHAVQAVIAAGVTLIALVGIVSIVGRLSYDLAIFDGLLTRLMVRWQVPPEYFGGRAFSRFGSGLMMAIPITMVAVALAQSLYAFRRIHVDRRFRAMQAALLVAATVITLLTIDSYSDAVVRLHQSAPAVELVTAARAVLTESRPTDGAALPMEELRKAGTLSTPTQRWLAGSVLTIEHGRRYRGERLYVVRVQFPQHRYTSFLVRVPEVQPQR